jgi:hypothetical protein
LRLPKRDDWVRALYLHQPKIDEPEQPNVDRSPSVKEPVTAPQLPLVLALRLSQREVLCPLNLGLQPTEEKTDGTNCWTENDSKDRNGVHAGEGSSMLGRILGQRRSCQLRQERPVMSMSPL